MLIEAKKRRKEIVAGKLINIDDVINIYDGIKWTNSGTDIPSRGKSPVVKRKKRENRNTAFELDSRDFCKPTREFKHVVQRLAELPEATASMFEIDETKTFRESISKKQGSRTKA